jgi:hypothetical protein
MLTLDIGAWAEALSAAPCCWRCRSMLAGLVSFFSRASSAAPGYLLRHRSRCRRVMDGSAGCPDALGSNLFVLGFAVIFVTTGVVAGSLGRAL